MAIPKLERGQSPLAKGQSRCRKTSKSSKAMRPAAQRAAVNTCNKLNWRLISQKRRKSFSPLNEQKKNSI